jgi:hypothetical protein
VITIQSGHNLYVTNTNALNAFGINGAEGDFGEIAAGCSNYQLGTPGSVTSKLNNYFNKRCFTSSYPVVGADARATGFGNSKPGLLRGPAQNNVDFALQKAFSFKIPGELVRGDFRAELFNAFNTPQFGDPKTTLDSASFGVINTTVVAPRIMQLAVKFSF